MPGNPFTLTDIGFVAEATKPPAPAGDVPVNVVAPVVTGVASEDSELTTTDGTWTNSPTGYAYQWIRGESTEIDGATAAAYTLVNADVGSTVKCRVTASNGSGAGSPAFSAPTATVAGWVYVCEGNWVSGDLYGPGETDFSVGQSVKVVGEFTETNTTAYWGEDPAHWVCASGFANSGIGSIYKWVTF